MEVTTASNVIAWVVRKKIKRFDTQLGWYADIVGKDEPDDEIDYFHFYYVGDFYLCEVIGNIHDKPEVWQKPISGI